MVDLSPLHRDAAQGTTPGARAAIWIKGLASRIQNECNNQDFAAIRELAVQAALQADDFALTVEHGDEEARRIRDSRSAGPTGVDSSQRVAPSVQTPLAAREDAPHAGPTDLQRAPTPEHDGTVTARPATGERAQSAPKGNEPAVGGGGTPSAEKEQKGESALSHTAQAERDKPEVRRK